MIAVVDVIVVAADVDVLLFLSRYDYPILHLLFCIVANVVL